ncbi:hypothetical protein J11TS1_12620 [Oceanobacillus sp. J11TS1]|nr:hypothetical protein J11TS1_12620 [Oceanobacillus sp. J11TS1]
MSQDSFSNKQNKGSKIALVVGANGVIGKNLIDHLVSLKDWKIIGLSRRGGEEKERVRYISVDLLDRGDSQDKLRKLTNVTHIFYAAYQDRPTWAELVPPNLTMFFLFTAIYKEIKEGRKA